MNSAEQLDCVEKTVLSRRGEEGVEEELSVVKVAFEQTSGFWDFAMDLLKYVFINMIIVYEW